MCATLILAVLFFLSFGIFNDSKIPLNMTTISIGKSVDSSLQVSSASSGSTVNERFLQYKLDFFNFVPVGLGFLGWLLFVMFAGIGLVSLPMELILGFFYQPQYVRYSVIIRGLRESWRRRRLL